MYNDFFRFRQSPFSIAPDPGFLYLSQRHREALAHLMYGLKTDGGFVLITGEVGTGKTTLIRSVIEQVPEHLDVAFVLNPRLTVTELLETLCDELHVPLDEHGRTVKYYVDRLSRYLLDSHARGRSTVVVIDEAQNLPPVVLEQIRLLTNLETNDRKLLRIILVGQPELDAVLERPDMRQLAQRITARCHLTALDRRETRAYVAHRLVLAGGHPGMFTPAALSELYRLTGGIPRLINIIADRSLLGAYVENRLAVTRRILRSAAREVSGEAHKPSRRAMPILGASLGGVVGALLAAAALTWTAFDLEWPQSWLPGGGERLEAGAATPVTTPAEILRPAADAVATMQESDPDREPAREPFLVIGPGNDLRLAADWPEQPLPPGAPEAMAAEQIIRPSERPAAVTPVPAPMPTPRAGAPGAGAPGAGAPGAGAPDIVPRPAGMTTYRTMLFAFEALFERWARPFDDSDLPCNVAPGVGLQCLRRSGGWEELRRINHPAVLEFRDANGDAYFAALTHYEHDRVELRVGRHTLQRTVADLQANWPGRYILLWEMPPDYRGNIALGDEQPSVAWLRRHLSHLLSLELDSPQPARFDRALDSALREFQQRHGLVADGIAGPATWMQISAKVADVPLLDAPGADLSRASAGGT
jgi:general secretion pathway protein A